MPALTQVVCTRTVWSALFMSIILLLSSAGPASRVTAQSAMADGAPPLTEAEVRAFVDAFMAEQMTELRVPGAALVIVQGDEVLLAEGYGTADLATGAPVDVNETVFRAGSVSKLFTATALMQLVESGRVRLDGDVNDYLTSLQLEPRFDRPVTVADLLLHTAGFDDVFFGMHVRSADELESLGTFLGHHLPERHVPPGEFIAYNDHGYTLAGLLIEDVTGQPFDEYMDEHILEPLAMGGSTFAQPLPPELAARLAVGYRWDGGGFQPYVHDFVQVAPAAALTGPASDLGNFIIAHLNEGRLGETSILRPETVAAMHATQFVHHPALRGRGYGFSEWRENGYRAVFHDGGNPGFLNRMMLIPEANVGFYLTFNGDLYSSATRFHRAFTEQFFDAFLPQADVEPAMPEAIPFERPASAFTGHYREMQAYSHDTFQKLASLPNQAAVRADGDRLLAFGRDYVPVEPLLFVSPSEESTIAFRTSGDGVSHLFIGSGAFVKVPWYEAQPVQLGLVLWFLTMFLAAAVAGLIWRSAPGSVRVTLIAWGLLNLVFLAGMAFALLQLDPWTFVYGPPAGIVALLAVPPVTLALAFVIGWLTVSGWRSGEWGRLARGFMTIVTVAAFAFPLFLDFWNLLGFKY